MYKFVLLFFFIHSFIYLLTYFSTGKKIIFEDFARTKYHPLPFFSKILLELQKHFG